MEGTNFAWKLNEFVAGSLPRGRAGPRSGVEEVLIRLIRWFDPLRRRKKEFSVRAFRRGDEVAIVDLCIAAQRRYGGHIPRSVSFWTWSILKRPGISPADILLVEAEEGIVGYGAVKGDGMVLDWAIDPSLTPQEQGRAADLLARALEERAAARGAETFTVSCVSAEDPASRALLEAGYRTDEAESMTVAVLDPPGLIAAILRARTGPKWGSPESRILLQLAPGGYRVNPSPRIGITWSDELAVTEADDEFRPTFVIDTDLSSLTDLIFARVAVGSLLEAGRVSVEPEAARPSGLEFLQLLVLRSPWHIPPADIQ